MIQNHMAKNKKSDQYVSNIFSLRVIERFTLCLLVATFKSADNISNQIGPRSGPTNCRA